MPAVRTLLFAILCLVAVGRVAAESGEWEMRSRVFCDATAGIAFRYPYGYEVRDQYKAELYRGGQRGQQEGSGEVREVVINGKKVRVVISEAPPEKEDADVRAFSVLASEMKDTFGGELGLIGDKLCATKLTWTPFDYYLKSDARPQSSPLWATKGLLAMTGEAKGHCGLVIKNGDRYSGIVMTGALSDFDNQAIVDSFEVMPGVVAKGKPPRMTWRESQGRTGKVIDGTGRLITAAGKVSPAAWKKGWDLETAHYHITTQVSPQRLQQYGTYLEGLYRAYSAVYEPDAVPPYKLEIHVFNTQRDFMEAAADHGFPVGQGVGGFFVPSLLSIFVYEESAKWGGEDFSVEHVMAHECSHQFLHVTCNGSDHVPTWINEGLAVYFESGVFSGGRFVTMPPRERIERLKQIYQQEKSTLAPVDKYLGHYGHISADAYGEVYALTYFWLFGTAQDPSQRYDIKHNPGLAHFREYWQALKRHENGTTAFENIFMKDMIKAKGSREAAISAWQSAFYDYVLHATFN
jgi:hypothetical protein